MSRIIITADSTFDMQPQTAEALDIKVIPSYVRMGEGDLPDYPDVTMFDLFEYHDKSGKLPQTSAASPWDYTEFFKQFEGDDVDIVHIAKSSKMSCCRDNAEAAVQSVKNLHVFDSLTIAGGSAMIAAEATRLRDKGCGVVELLDALDDFRGKIAGAFIVEHLDYLRKGGRCSALAHMGANILRLRPQIVIRDGAMTVGKKYRGKYEKCLHELIDDVLGSASGRETAYVSHTIVDEELLDDTITYLQAKGGFKQIVVQPAGSAVSCHCGPSTFGIFLEK